MEIDYDEPDHWYRGELIPVYAGASFFKVELGHRVFDECMRALWAAQTDDWHFIMAAPSESASGSWFYYDGKSNVYFPDSIREDGEPRYLPTFINGVTEQMTFTEVAAALGHLHPEEKPLRFASFSQAAMALVRVNFDADTMLTWGLYWWVRPERGREALAALKAASRFLRVMAESVGDDGGNE